MTIFDRTRNRHVRSESIQLLPSLARTLTGNGAGLAAGVGVIAATLAVTAASGTTPTLDAKIQTSPDGTNWTDVATFAQKTGVSSERKLFTVDRHVRVAYTIAGTTPSFTFSVLAERG